MYIPWIAAALRLGWADQGGAGDSVAKSKLPEGPVYMLAPGPGGATFLSATGEEGGVGELVSAEEHPTTWLWRRRTANDVVIVANGTDLCLTAPQGRYGATPGDVTLRACPAADDPAPRATWVHVGTDRSARLLMRSGNLFLGYNGRGSVAATNNYEWDAEWAVLE